MNYPDSIESEFSAYNLNIPKLAKAWRVSFYDQDEELLEMAIANNISRVHELEQECSGAASALQAEFGIQVFARYSLEKLVQQYLNKDKPGPYGITVFPSHDWNGHYYSRQATYDALDRQLTGYALVRHFEVGGKYALLKRLRMCNQKYNHNGIKIGFAVLAAHAHDDHLGFGREDEARRGDLTIADLGSHDLVDEVVQYFKPGSPVAIDGCRTGRPKGIAAELSCLGFLSTGPIYSWTGITRFDPLFNQNNEVVSLRPRYYSSPQATYYGGRKIDNKYDITQL